MANANESGIGPYPDVEHVYTDKDSMLYALCVGYGYNSLDEAQLAFDNEKTSYRTNNSGDSRVPGILDEGRGWACRLGLPILFIPA